MNGFVVDQAQCFDRVSVQFNGGAEFRQVCRLADVKVVRRVADAVLEFVTWPVVGDVRLQPQLAVIQAQTENLLKNDPIEPACRARVPGPAGPTGVRRRAADVPGQHVGLSAVVIRRVPVRHS